MWLTNYHVVVQTTKYGGTYTNDYRLKVYILTPLGKYYYRYDSLLITLRLCLRPIYFCINYKHSHLS